MCSVAPCSTWSLSDDEPHQHDVYLPQRKKETVSKFPRYEAALNGLYIFIDRLETQVLNNNIQKIECHSNI